MPPQTCQQTPNWMAKKKGKQSPKRCKHDKQVRSCRICGPQYFCCHDFNKYKCVKCNTKLLCNHNKRTTSCSKCNPKLLCKHGKTKKNCKECTPGSYCIHGKYKSDCNICSPHLFCKHGKAICGECKRGYCEHDKVKRLCVKCVPHEFCEHGKKRTRCRPCGGSLYCEHNIEKTTCRECGNGVKKCVHGKRTTYCTECGGKCIHERLLARYCKICTPNQYYAKTLRGRMRNIWKRDKFTKSKKTFELLGCNMETFRAHIELQFTEGMTWDNHGSGPGKWQFDHVVPLLFGDPDQKTMEERMHYTNLQPMWSHVNAAKGNRHVG